MSYIVAVDGGGSRCRLASFSPEGECTATVEVPGHASLTLGAEVAWRHIHQGLCRLRAVLQLPEHEDPDILSMGLAGTLCDQRRAAFLQCIPCSSTICLHTDGYAQLVGAADDAPAACLVAGTGSVLHWVDQHGTQGMAGGWGFPAGDQGGGAWLGLRALQCYINAFDQQSVSKLSRHQPLISLLSGTVGTSISQIQRWTTQRESGVVAQLAPLVFSAADQGDALAQSLLDEALSHLLELVSLAPQDLTVYVAGSVGERLRNAMGQHLRSRLGCAKGDALYGGWKIAMRQRRTL